jgi:taurine dioxygenase
MSLVLTPLSASFGIEATGIDLSGAVPADDAEALLAALRDHLVLVVRGQRFSTAQYVEAMRLFGTPMRQHLTKLLDPDHPEIAILDSRIANTRRDDGKIMPIGSRDWHTDHTNHPLPPKMTALYAVKLPSTGGDTGFANMQAAFQRLNADEQASLSKLRTVNGIEQDTGYVDEATRREFTAAPQTHPFIRTHPETGRKAIYVHPGKLARFEDWEPAESKAFVNALLERVLVGDITYRHKWRVGDLVIWDNRALLHVAHTDYDPAEGRIMHRMCLEGDAPF